MTKAEALQQMNIEEGDVYDAAAIAALHVYQSITDPAFHLFTEVIEYADGTGNRLYASTEIINDLLLEELV